jgi:hypothetical protein
VSVTHCHTFGMDASSGLEIESRHSVCMLLLLDCSVIDVDGVLLLSVRTAGIDNCNPNTKLLLYTNVYNIKVDRGVEVSMKYNCKDRH